MRARLGTIRVLTHMKERTALWNERTFTFMDVSLTITRIDMSVTRDTYRSVMNFTCECLSAGHHQPCPAIEMNVSMRKLQA